MLRRLVGWLLVALAWLCYVVGGGVFGLSFLLLCVGGGWRRGVGGRGEGGSGR